MKIAASAPMDTNIHISKKVELNSDVRNVLVVDDSFEVCELLGRTIVEQHPDIIVLTTIHPIKAISLIEKYYFDVVVSDINMPEMNGDEVIMRVKSASPSTCTMAMTGLGMESAYIAGRAQPDIFINKNNGFGQLFKELENGLRETENRRNIILKKIELENGSTRKNWRSRRRVRELLGFTERKMTSARGAMIAASLVYHNVDVSREELSYIAGFSSYQRLKSHIEKFFSDIEIPSPVL